MTLHQLPRAIAEQPALKPGAHGSRLGAGQLNLAGIVALRNGRHDHIGVAGGLEIGRPPRFDGVVALVALVRPAVTWLGYTATDNSNRSEAG